MYVRREVAHSTLGADGRKKLLQATLEQLVALGFPKHLAANILWWRYRNGLSLTVRKVLQ